MENTIARSNSRNLNELIREASITQKKGLPFILASVIIWSVICLVQFSGKSIQTINLYAFMSSALLMPLAFMFSKVLKADIFKKNDNPVCKLGFLCTLNQMLYLLIVMWAFSVKPESMVMLYAMVFGAHLLPFGWVYGSISYKVMSVVETVGALLIGLIFGNIAVTAFMVVCEVVLSAALFIETGKVSRRN